MTRLDNDGLPHLRREARPAPAYSGPTAHQIMESFVGPYPVARLLPVPVPYARGDSKTFSRLNSFSKRSSVSATAAAGNRSSC
jgi:hypothetical protein